MKSFKLLFLLTLLGSLPLLTGCIKDPGNSIEVTTTGSVNKTNAGVTYIDLDYVNLSATSNDLQKEDLDAGDRVLTTVHINLDNQEAPIINGVYNATFLTINEFDCKSYIPNPQATQFQSDTLSTLVTASPFLIHRKKDNIITFTYTMPDDGQLRLIQPRPFDPDQAIPTDTLYLVYDKGAKFDKEADSDYISFKLPPYPVNSHINVVIRFFAHNYNTTTTKKDEVSPYLFFHYYLKEGL